MCILVQVDMVVRIVQVTHITALNFRKDFRCTGCEVVHVDVSYSQVEAFLLYLYMDFALAEAA